MSAKARDLQFDLAGVNVRSGVKIPRNRQPGIVKSFVRLAAPETHHDSGRSPDCKRMTRRVESGPQADVCWSTPSLSATVYLFSG
ncbi:MAG: hypothetical protein WB902_22850, partial [Acetobacteraceae bacterium]